MTVAEFHSRHSGDEVITLPDGSKATIQEITDAFAGFKEKSGGSFKHLKSQPLPEHRVKALRDAGKHGHIHSVKGAASPWHPRIAKLRQHPAKRSAPAKHGHPSSGHRLDVFDLPSPVTPLRPWDEPRSDDFDSIPSPEMLVTPAEFVPAQTPFDDAWDDVHGDQDLVGVYETFTLGNAYNSDQTDAWVTCHTGIELGLYVLGQRVELANLLVGGSASVDGADTSTELTFLGKFTPWTKTGNFTDEKWTKDLDHELAHGVLPIAGPLGINWSVSGKGTMGIEGATLETAFDGRKATCAASMKRVARAELSFTATVHLTGVSSLIEKFASAGVRGKMMVVSETIASKTGVTLTADPTTHLPLKLTEEASLVRNATMLSGSLTAFVTFSAPDSLQWVLGLIDEEKFPDKNYERVIFPENDPIVVTDDVIKSIPAHESNFTARR